jgi:hypothetical protein
MRLGLGLGFDRGRPRAASGALILLSLNTVAENASVGATIGTLSVSGGSGSYTFTETADPDSKFSITGASLKVGAALNYEAATFHTVTVQADNGVDTPLSRLFNIFVTNINEAPTVANVIPDQDATQDVAFSFQFASNTFADVDAGDTLTYTATKSDNSALPAWLTFTAATRTFSGTPDSGDVGTLSVKVTATDGGALSVTDTFDIVVAGDLLPAPAAPTLTLVSGAGDNQPDFTATGDILIGDTVTVYDYTDVGLSVLEDSGSAVAVSDGTIDLTDLIGPLVDGTKYFIARTSRPLHATSGASNTVTETISTFTPSLNFSVARNSEYIGQVV